MRSILTCLIIFCPLVLTAQEKWSLEECIEYAREHNIEVLRQQFQNESIGEDITVAKGNYYPNATFNATQGFNVGSSFNISTGVGQQESSFNSFSLSSSILLYNGFRNKYLLQQARLNAERGLADLERVILDISLNIADRYLTVLFNKEILAVAEEQEIISRQEVERLTRLNEAGLSSRSELLEMESTYSLDQKEKIIAANNLKNSLIELRELLGVEMIDNFDVEKIEVEDINDNYLLLAPDEIFEEAVETNPLLKATRLDAEISNKNIKIARTSYYPSVNMNYSFGSSYYHIFGREDLVYNQETELYENNGFLIQLDNNKTHYLGFSAVVPIFNRFQSKSTVDRAEIDLKIAKTELLNQKKELQNRIEVAYNDVLSAKAGLMASETAIVSQAEAFSIAQKQYQEGNISSYEFLESKSKYIQTQSDLIQAKYDYFFKIKVLEYFYLD